MNNQQAIEVLSDFDKQASAKADGAYQSTIGKMACDLAIVALKKADTIESNCTSWNKPC